MQRGERVVGAVVGSAVGDALGAPFEFGPPGVYSARFPEPDPTTGGATEMCGGGGWRAGEAADDTQMAVLVAVRLIVAGVLDEVLSPLTDHPDKLISSYIRNNFWFTTSGCFYDGPFHLARQAIGDDRLVFSVDYPFADNRQASDWFARLGLEPETRHRIAYQTAEQLLGLH